jgi:L-rhamnose isomerase
MNYDKAYELARESYGGYGVDTDKAVERLERFSLSLHCWQIDDVGGFERPDASLEGGGIQVTGSYPGKPRNREEFIEDLDKVYSLLPGSHRLSLHTHYGDFGGKKVDRNEVEPEHFAGWVDWSKRSGVDLDFNCTVFSHPLSDDGFSLSSKDEKKRNFWIDHVKRAREISAFMGREQGNPCIHNIWLHDGIKDIPADRMGYRRILMHALDEVFEKEYSAAEIKDAVECKLFGIGSEAYVVGSHEFYMGYAYTRGKMLCLDLGHFHPTESVADKISSVMLFSDELLLHVSRPIRWDSDHIVVLNDEVRALFQEIVRSGRAEDIHVGLDFFDGTLNRVGAYAIGARNALKAMLLACLEPSDKLVEYEEAGDYFGRLHLMEELKTLPFGAVWDRYCRSMGVPTDREIRDTVHAYEREVLSKRG